jgi:hypothetical protein
MIQYRPVGLRELELIATNGWKAFPPRLPIQPIFYPVLNFQYAEQIVREWNVTDPVSGYAGFVTRFEVEDDYARQFDIQVVGGASVHQELWIPAEELDNFNAHIVGQISVELACYGEQFAGAIDTETNLPIFEPSSA